MGYFVSKRLNPKLHIVHGNSKLSRTDKVYFLTWSLMSRKTCPYSTPTCRRKCYGRDNENFSSVSTSREENYEESLKDSFVSDMIEHIEYHLRSKKLQKRKLFFRIHVSGDFYSQEYLDKWVKIVNHFRGRNVLFLCYTKSLRYFEKYDLKDVNMRILYSIWWDSPESDILLAEKWGLSVFIAATPIEVTMYVNEGAFECIGDCRTCRECYTGSSKKIVIKYH